MGIPADLPREYWDYPGSAYQLMNDPEYRRAAEAAWSEFAAQPQPSKQASDSTSPPITPEQQRLLDQIAQENGGDWSRLTSDQMQRLRDAGLVVHRYDGWGGYDYEVIHVGDKYYVYYEPWWGDYQLQQITPDAVAPQAAVDLAWNKPTDALAPRNTKLTPELIEAKFRELYAHDPDAIRLLDLLKERGWRIELRDFYVHDWYIYEQEKILALDHDGWMFELTLEEAAHQLYDMLSTGLYGRTYQLVGEHIVLAETWDSFLTRQATGTLMIVGGIAQMGVAVMLVETGAGTVLAVVVAQYGASNIIEGITTMTHRGGGINPGQWATEQVVTTVAGDENRWLGTLLYRGGELAVDLKAVHHLATHPRAAIGDLARTADRAHDVAHTADNAADAANTARTLSRADDLEETANVTTRLTSSKNRLSESGAGRYLADTWHQGTFPNRTQSVRYHVLKHGKGRTARQYTRDAMEFFQANRHLGERVILKDGTPGIKISIKVTTPEGTVKRIGGYWTEDGKLVTFWD